MQKLVLGNRKISTERPAFVMGIVNATPDSFYKENRGGVELALKLIEQGADILDIGGESTRPGFSPVNDEQQIERIIPVIKAIRKVSDIPISIDTRSSSVFLAACEEGADVLNDVSALADEKMAEVIRKSEASVILMHGFGLDENHNTDRKITENVKTYLYERTNYALSNNIKKEKIFWDPGIGFGKTMEENVLLIKSTDNLIKENFPLVMALSRKRVIAYMNENIESDRLAGTLAANMIAVTKGAKILRVHDVLQTVEMLNVMKYL